MFTYTEAARYLGLPSVDALRMMVYRRAAPPRFSFGKRDVRFLKADLDRWLAAKAAAVRSREAEAAIPSAREKVPRRVGRPTKAETIARRRNA